MTIMTDAMGDNEFTQALHSLTLLFSARIAATAMEHEWRVVTYADSKAKDLTNNG